ncbi:hypothetical protein [Megasphaera sp.]|uniref:hypothetical protein n=1 Tax=Megasphaera sp. TaxID=2023260 RepID=UPI003AB85BC8
MDTKAIAYVLKNMFRVGKVSSLNPEQNTARVYFEDQNGMVSCEMAILNRGSKVVKDYWMPDVGEDVLCLNLPNDKNKTVGWILGSYFSQKDSPQIADDKVRRIDYGDRSYIEYDRKSHTLNIHCVGNINITGATINLN